MSISDTAMQIACECLADELGVSALSDSHLEENAERLVNLALEFEAE